jgi:hypothetical protein
MCSTNKNERIDANCTTDSAKLPSIHSMYPPPILVAVPVPVAVAVAVTVAIVPES